MDAVPVRYKYGSLSFEKRKASKEINEHLEQDDLVGRIFSHSTSSPLLVPKNGYYRLVEDYCCLNEQMESMLAVTKI